MTNIVTVTANLGAGAEGNWLFAATGTLMSDANVAIVTPVVQGYLDSSGNMIVQTASGVTTGAALLASDNFGTGELLWNVYMNVRGVNAIHWNDFQVNFALGASQNLFTILSAAGWTPTPS